MTPTLRKGCSATLQSSCWQMPSRGSEQLVWSQWDLKTHPPSPSGMAAPVDLSAMIFFVVTFPKNKKMLVSTAGWVENDTTCTNQRVRAICAMMTFVWVESVFHSHVCKFCATLRLPAASPIIAATRWDACRPRQHSAMDIGCLEIFWVVMEECGSIWDDSDTIWAKTKRLRHNPLCDWISETVCNVVGSLQECWEIEACWSNYN